MRKIAATGAVLLGMLLLTATPATAADYVAEAPTCSVDRPAIYVGEKAVVTCAWEEDVTGLPVTFSVTGLGVLENTLGTVGMSASTGTSTITTAADDESARATFAGPRAGTYTVVAQWNGTDGKKSAEVDIQVNARSTGELATTGGGTVSPVLLWGGAGALAAGLAATAMAIVRRRKNAA